MKKKTISEQSVHCVSTEPLSQGGTWFRDVSVDLVDAVGQAQGRVDVEVVDGLLPGPAQRVDASVQDQAKGTNQVVGVVPD